MKKRTGKLNRRVFDYKVVMYSKDVKMDMRGRCSAGQKVSESLKKCDRRKRNNINVKIVIEKFVLLTALVLSVDCRKNLFFG